MDFLDVILALALVALAFAFLYYPMATTPLVPGIDGPYYIVQVRWLLKRGWLKYPDPPLAFYVMALVALLVRDVPTAVEVTSALVTAFSTIPAYALVRRLTGSRAAAFAAGLAAVANPFVVRLSSDFMKNSMGLLWLYSFIYFNYSYIESGRARDLAGLLASLALCALTHILDYGVALLYAALALPLAGKKWRRALPGAIAAALSLVALTLAPFIVGGDVFKGYAFVEELTEELELELVRLDWIAFSIGIFSSLALYGVMGSSGERRGLAIASAVIGLALNLPIIPAKWLFRFRLMTAVPLSHCIGLLAASAEQRGRLAVAALLLSLVAAMGFEAYRSVRPSIPPPALEELKIAMDRAKALGAEVVVPNPRLGYWAEVLSDDVSRHPTSPRYVVIVLKDFRRPPPRGIPVFDGRFVLAVAHFPRAAGSRPAPPPGPRTPPP